MAAIALVSALALCSAARAAPTAASIEGAWSFTTDQYRLVEDNDTRAYTIVKGDLRVGPPDATGARACDMHTTQTWYARAKGDSAAKVTEEMSSVQTCAIAIQGKDVTITGTLVSATDAGYLADDFKLTFEGADRMSGAMHSRWSQGRPVARAFFFRNIGAIS